MSEYDFKNIELKWQKYWEENGVFKTKTHDSTKEKYYVLEMFPYPSGNIHMGHLRNYTIGDVVARFKRAQNYNVIHPMGWDAFGLPAENAAIERNIHPGKWTKQNISNMRERLKQVGLSYDWDLELATCNPEYYVHEQKIFLKFLENELAYRKESYVNWDPVDNTVLANEQVVNGRGWRSGALVEKKKLNQWFLKVTKYADELLDNLKTLKNWPEKVLLMQEKWIGKSSGALIKFKIENENEELEIYTTRPDTLFGASFCAISPNHYLAEKISKNNQEAAIFIEKCNQTKTSEEDLAKQEKIGFNTGLKVINPLTGESHPLFIANFVLMEYGTGAIFACPAHDERDFEFATKYNLPIKQVVTPGEEVSLPYLSEGTLINSGEYNGLSTNEAKKIIIAKLSEKNIAEEKIQFRLRDWGVSRQRYWGCPIPVIHCEDCGVVPVKEQDLPVTLPEDVDFSVAGNPLDRHPTWKHTSCPSCGKDAVRDTDTFDTFFESSWYFARFCNPNTKDILDKEACNYWLSVDQYIGGVEHAVLHLLYSRFFTMAMNDCGIINNVREPFKGLLTQGMVCHATYQDSEGKFVYPSEVAKDDNGNLIHEPTGLKVTEGRMEKMSKSKKNVVEPVKIIEKFGADTARLFMLSDSPPERDLIWSDKAVEGSWRFLNKLWNLVHDNLGLIKNMNQTTSNLDPKFDKLNIKLHVTIQAVTEDLKSFHFNKSIARIRELLNELDNYSLSEMDNNLLHNVIVSVLKLLNPMVPHITEELWNKITDGKQTLCENEWPKFDEAIIARNKLIIAIQVMGKLRGTIEVNPDISEDDLKEMALNEPNVRKFTDGKEIKKIIIIAGKIINILVG